MQPVNPVAPYTSRLVGTDMLELADGSAFKVYWLDIAGRSEPEKCEWGASGRDRDAALKQLGEAGVSGVGFICLFPHIAKVFFFGESLETNLYAEAFRGDPFRPSSLDGARGVEIGCAAEVDIAGKEFALWRAAATVEEYLASFVEAEPCGFENHAKLGEYALRHASGPPS